MTTVITKLVDGQQVQIKGTRPYYQYARVFTLRGFYAKNPEFEVPAGASQRMVVTAGKAALGLTGVRCETVDCGDWFQLRPIGSCTVAFLRAC